MPDAALGQTRDDMMANAGKLLAADGSVVDATALLQSIAAGVGGTGDIDAIREILAASLVLLEQIQGSNAAIETATESSAVDLAAIEIINTAIRTAVQIIDNYVGTIGGATTAAVAVIGANAEATVPTEVADGQPVGIWMDTLGRLIQLSTDLAQSAQSVSDIAPAQMQIARWLDWVALTTPGDETPEAVVDPYENFTVEYTIGTIDTSVDLKIWGSIDGGTTWFLLTPTIQVLAADDQTDAVSFSGMAIERIKCEFDDEAGGVAATATFKLMASN